MPPVLIAAGVTAAATIGGAALSSSATKKAANKAADTSLQTANMNNALTQQIYNKNTANLSPFMANGLQASNALTGMLLGPQATSPVAQTQQYGQPVAANALSGAQPMPAGFYPWDEPGHYGRTAQQVWDEQQSMAPQPMMQQPMPMQAPGTVAASVNPWDQFRNSTNYQFRFDQGQKALGHSMLGNLESGAAGKAFINYGQNTASNELGNYMSLLANQQNMGMSGASALAGVGQNMVNNVTANNNSAGSAAANAALMAGSSNAMMYGNVANALGNVAGSVSSYYSTPKQYR